MSDQGLVRSYAQRSHEAEIVVSVGLQIQLGKDLFLGSLKLLAAVEFMVLCWLKGSHGRQTVSAVVKSDLKEYRDPPF